MRPDTRARGKTRTPHGTTRAETNRREKAELVIGSSERRKRLWGPIMEKAEKKKRNEMGTKRITRTGGD